MKQTHVFILAIGFYTLSAPLSAQAQGLPDSIAASIPARIQDRDYPSVFIAWNPAENLRQQPNDTVVPLSSLEKIGSTIARHDLFFNVWSHLGLRLPKGQQYPLLCHEFTAESIQLARQRRAALLAFNPHIVILVAVNYYSA